MHPARLVVTLTSSPTHGPPPSLKLGYGGASSPQAPLSQVHDILKDVVNFGPRGPQLAFAPETSSLA
jgi:hypothetical protein